MKLKILSIVNGLLLFSISSIIGCSVPDGSTEPLPAEFKSYQSLNTHYNAGNHKVELLAQTENYFPYPIRAFENGHGEVIVEVNKVQNDVILGDDYLKLNKDGKIIDSLFLPSSGGRENGFIGDFILFVSVTAAPYYTTWPLNGDTTKKEIKILNSDFSWPEEKLDKITSNILATSKYTFYDISYPHKRPEDKTCNKQLFFFKGGKWQVLYHKYEKDIYLDDEETMLHLRQDIYRTGDDAQPDAVQNFNLKYFEKKKWIDYGHAIGGGQAGFSTTGWEGTAYFEVFLGKTRLKIKKENIIIEKPTPAIPETLFYNSYGDGEDVTNFSLNFYTNPNYNFGFYSTNATSLYIIR